MNLLAQIKRDGHLLKKSVRPTKPKKWIKKVSPKRAKEGAIYRAKRKAFLGAHRFCEVKTLVGKCSENFVGQEEHSCFNKSQDVHHTKGRLGGNYLDESTWLAVCRKCHDHIHAHPKEARELKLLA